MVDSQLVDTTIEMIGDFEEYTYTYEYTETITESVDQTSEVITTQTSSVTTDNLIPSSTITDTNVNIVGPQGNTFGMPGAEFTTGNQSNQGSTRIYSRELDYENAQSIDYGVTVYSHVSNATVPDCANATSDCRDDFSITVNLYNDDVLVETTTHLYEGIDWHGSRDYAYTADVSEIMFDYGTMELYGIDRGYYQEYYGPGFSDPFVELTYNVITEVINSVINTVEMQTINTTDVYVYESIYHPPVIDVQLEPISATEFEVEVLQVDSFGVETVEVFEVTLDVEMSTEEPAAMEIEAIEAAPEPEEEAVEVQVEEAKEDVQESGSDVEESVDTPDEKPEPKTEVRRANSPSKPQAYSVALDSVKVALMVQNESASVFKTYQQQAVPDVPFYRPVALDGGETIDNPYASYMTGASDILMDEMVDMQWQN